MNVFNNLYRLLLIICMLALFSCDAPVTEDDAIKKNQEGVSYMNAGNYDQALKAFKESVESQKLSLLSKGTVYRNLALTYNQLEQIDSSVHYSTLAAKCYTKNSYDYLINMADVDLTTGKISKGLSRLLKAADINPNELAVNNTLGLIYMGEYGGDNIDYNKALAFNKKAFELAGDRVTEEVLGRNYYKLEDYDNAELHYDQLLENYPDMITHPLYAGMIKYKLKKTKEADLLFDKVITMDSTYKETIADFKIEN